MTAVICVLAMLVTGWTAPAVCAQPPILDTAPGFPADLAQLEIPETLGTLEEAFLTGGDRTVILIQDAHAVPDAQKNIHKLIAFFQKEYGADSVALEGASGPLDTFLFRKFPDQALLKKTMRRYHDRAELSGVSASALFDAGGVDYRGVEDWPLYEKGVALYQKALEKEPALLTVFQAERKTLARKKEKIYPPALLAFDRLLEKNEGKAEYLAETLKAAAAIRPTPEGSPLEALVRQITAAETTQEELDQDVRLAVQEFRKTLIAAGKSMPVIFNQQFQAFETGKLPAAAFALTLQQTAAQEKTRIVFAPELLRPMRIEKKLRQIRSAKIYEDIQGYFQEAKNALMTTPQQRALDRRSRNLMLREKLAKLELTREEWEEIKSYSHFVIASEAKQSRSWGRVVAGSKPAFTTGISSDNLKYPIAFYENAEKREQAFLENLNKTFVSPKSRATIFVAGGFHSHAMARHLREENIRYLLITPKMESLPEASVYREQMRGHVSWQNYFRIENGRVNLRDAFFRVVRDELFKVEGRRWKVEGKQKAKQNIRLLKFWRDEIIRGLADEGRLAEAGNYTRFLDEVAAVRAGSGIKGTVPGGSGDSPWVTSGSLLDRLTRFIDGLKHLDSTKQLTEENIFQLLKANTVQVPAVGSQFAESSMLPASILGMKKVSGASNFRTGRSEIRLNPAPVMEIGGVSIHGAADFPAATAESFVRDLTRAGYATQGLELQWRGKGGNNYAFQTPQNRILKYGRQAGADPMDVPLKNLIREHYNKDELLKYLIADTRFMEDAGLQDRLIEQEVLEPNLNHIVFKNMEKKNLSLVLKLFNAAADHRLAAMSRGIFENDYKLANLALARRSIVSSDTGRPEDFVFIVYYDFDLLTYEPRAAQRYAHHPAGIPAADMAQTGPKTLTDADYRALSPDGAEELFKYYFTYRSVQEVTAVLDEVLLGILSQGRLETRSRLLERMAGWMMENEPQYQGAAGRLFRRVASDAQLFKDISPAIVELSLLAQQEFPEAGWLERMNLVQDNKLRRKAAREARQNYGTMMMLRRFSAESHPAIAGALLEEFKNKKSTPRLRTLAAQAVSDLAQFQPNPVLNNVEGMQNDRAFSALVQYFQGLARSEVRGEEEGKGRNVFEVMWNATEGHPFKHRVRLYAVKMAELFARDEAQLASIKKDARDLRVFIMPADAKGFLMHMLSTLLRAFFLDSPELLRRFFSDLYRSFLEERASLKSTAEKFSFLSTVIVVMPAMIFFRAVWQGLLEIRGAWKTWRRMQQKNFLGYHVKNGILFWNQNPPLSTITHEIVHWLYAQNYIRSDFPVVNSITAYLSGPKLNKRFSKLAEIEMDQRGHAIERVEKKIRGGETVEVEADASRLMGHMLGLALQVEEAAMRRFTVSGFIFVPTWIFLRMQVFERRDILQVEEPSHSLMLQWIEEVSTVLGAFPNVTGLGWVNAADIVNFSHWLDEHQTVVSLEVRRYLLDLLRVWIERLQKPEIQALFEPLKRQPQGVSAEERQEKAGEARSEMRQKGTQKRINVNGDASGVSAQNDRRSLSRALAEMWSPLSQKEAWMPAWVHSFLIHRPMITARNAPAYSKIITGGANDTKNLFAYAAASVIEQKLSMSLWIKSLRAELKKLASFMGDRLLDNSHKINNYFIFYQILLFSPASGFEAFRRSEMRAPTNVQSPLEKIMRDGPQAALNAWKADWLAGDVLTDRLELYRQSKRAITLRFLDAAGDRVLKPGAGKPIGTYVTFVQNSAEPAHIQLLASSGYPGIDHKEMIRGLLQWLKEQGVTQVRLIDKGYDPAKPKVQTPAQRLFEEWDRLRRNDPAEPVGAIRMEHQLRTFLLYLNHLNLDKFFEAVRSEMRMERGNNIFEVMWNATEGHPFKQRVRLYAAQMAALFANDERKAAMAQKEAGRLKVFVVPQEPFKWLWYAWQVLFLQSVVDFVSPAGASLQFLKGYVRKKDWKLSAGRTAVFYYMGLAGVIYGTFPFGIISSIGALLLMSAIIATDWVRTRAARGRHLRDAVSFYRDQPPFSDVAHEVLHWLKYKKYISSDVPLASMISAYLDSSRSPKPQSHALALSITDAERIHNAVGWIDARTRYWLPKEPDESYVVGDLLGQNAHRLDALWRETGINGSIGLPTYFFMRSQLFVHEDMIAMTEPRNAAKLQAIERFVDRIIHLSSIGHLSDSAISEIMTAVHQEMTSLELGKDHEGVFSSMRFWLERVQKPEIQALFKPLQNRNPSTAGGEMNTAEDKARSEMRRAAGIISSETYLGGKRSNDPKEKGLSPSIEPQQLTSRQIPYYFFSGGLGVGPSMDWGNVKTPTSVMATMPKPKAILAGMGKSVNNLLAMPAAIVTGTRLNSIFPSSNLLSGVSIGFSPWGGSIARGIRDKTSRPVLSGTSRPARSETRRVSQSEQVEVRPPKSGGKADKTTPARQRKPPQRSTDLVELRKILKTAPALMRRSGVGKVIDVSAVSLQKKHQWFLAERLEVIYAAGVVPTDWVDHYRKVETWFELLTDLSVKVLALIDTNGQARGLLLSENYDQLSDAQFYFLASVPDADGRRGKDALLMDAFVKKAKPHSELRSEMRTGGKEFILPAPDRPTVKVWAGQFLRLNSGSREIRIYADGSWRGEHGPLRDSALLEALDRSANSLAQHPETAEIWQLNQSRRQEALEAFGVYPEYLPSVNASVIDLAIEVDYTAGVKSIQLGAFTKDGVFKLNGQEVHPVQDAQYAKTFELIERVIEKGNSAGPGKFWLELYPDIESLWKEIKQRRQYVKDLGSEEFRQLPKIREGTVVWSFLDPGSKRPRHLEANPATGLITVYPDQIPTDAEYSFLRQKFDQFVQVNAPDVYALWQKALEKRAEIMQQTQRDPFYLPEAGKGIVRIALPDGYRYVIAPDRTIERVALGVTPQSEKYPQLSLAKLKEIDEAIQAAKSLRPEAAAMWDPAVELNLKAIDLGYGSLADLPVLKEDKLWVPLQDKPVLVLAKDGKIEWFFPETRRLTRQEIDLSEASIEEIERRLADEITIYGTNRFETPLSFFRNAFLKRSLVTRFGIAPEATPRIKKERRSSHAGLLERQVEDVLIVPLANNLTAKVYEDGLITVNQLAYRDEDQKITGDIEAALEKASGLPEDIRMPILEFWEDAKARFVQLRLFDFMAADELPFLLTGVEMREGFSQIDIDEALVIPLQETYQRILINTQGQKLVNGEWAGIPAAEMDLYYEIMERAIQANPELRDPWIATYDQWEPVEEKAPPQQPLDWDPDKLDASIVSSQLVETPVASKAVVRLQALHMLSKPAKLARLKTIKIRSEVRAKPLLDITGETSLRYARELKRIREEIFGPRVDEWLRGFTQMGNSQIMQRAIQALVRAPEFKSQVLQRDEPSALAMIRFLVQRNIQPGVKDLTLFIRQLNQEMAAQPELRAYRFRTILMSFHVYVRFIAAFNTKEVKEYLISDLFVNSPREDKLGKIEAKMRKAMAFRATLREIHSALPKNLNDRVKRKEVQNVYMTNEAYWSFRRALNDVRMQRYLDSDRFAQLNPEDKLIAIVDALQHFGLPVPSDHLGYIFSALPLQISQRTFKQDVQHVALSIAVYRRLRSVLALPKARTWLRSPAFTKIDKRVKTKRFLEKTFGYAPDLKTQPERELWTGLSAGTKLRLIGPVVDKQQERLLAMEAVAKKRQERFFKSEALPKKAHNRFRRSKRPKNRMDTFDFAMETQVDSTYDPATRDIFDDIYIISNQLPAPDRQLGRRIINYILNQSGASLPGTMAADLNVRQADIERVLTALRMNDSLIMLLMHDDRGPRARSEVRSFAAKEVESILEREFLPGLQKFVEDAKTATTPEYADEVAAFRLEDRMLRAYKILLDDTVSSADWVDNQTFSLTLKNDQSLEPENTAALRRLFGMLPGVQSVQNFERENRWEIRLNAPAGQAHKAEVQTAALFILGTLFLDPQILSDFPDFSKTVAWLTEHKYRVETFWHNPQPLKQILTEVFNLSPDSMIVEIGDQGAGHIPQGYQGITVSPSNDEAVLGNVRALAGDGLAFLEDPAHLKKFQAVLFQQSLWYVAQPFKPYEKMRWGTSRNDPYETAFERTLKGALNDLKDDGLIIIHDDISENIELALKFASANDMETHFFAKQGIPPAASFRFSGIDRRLVRVGYLVLRRKARSEVRVEPLRDETSAGEEAHSPEEVSDAEVNERLAAMWQYLYSDQSHILKLARAASFVLESISDADREEIIGDAIVKLLKQRERILFSDTGHFHADLPQELALSEIELRTPAILSALKLDNTGHYDPRFLPNTPEVFLIQVLRRAMLDVLRKRKRYEKLTGGRMLLPSDWGLSAGDDPESVLFEGESGEPDPADSAELHDLWTLIHDRFMPMLPLAQAEILVMHYFDGLTMTEAMRKTGIDRTTLHTRLNEAQHKIRAMVELSAAQSQDERVKAAQAHLDAVLGTGPKSSIGSASSPEHIPLAHRILTSAAMMEHRDEYQQVILYALDIYVQPVMQGTLGDSLQRKEKVKAIARALMQGDSIETIAAREGITGPEPVLKFKKKYVTLLIFHALRLADSAQGIRSGQHPDSASLLFRRLVGIAAAKNNKPLENEKRAAAEGLRSEMRTVSGRMGQLRKDLKRFPAGYQVSVQSILEDEARKKIPPKDQLTRPIILQVLAEEGFAPEGTSQDIYVRAQSRSEVRFPPHGIQATLLDPDAFIDSHMAVLLHSHTTQEASELLKQNMDVLFQKSGKAHTYVILFEAGSSAVRLNTSLDVFLERPDYLNNPQLRSFVDQEVIAQNEELDALQRSFSNGQKSTKEYLNSLKEAYGQMQTNAAHFITPLAQYLIDKIDQGYSIEIQHERVQTDAVLYYYKHLRFLKPLVLESLRQGDVLAYLAAAREDIKALWMSARVRDEALRDLLKMAEAPFLDKKVIIIRGSGHDDIIEMLNQRLGVSVAHNPKFFSPVDRVRRALVGGAPMSEHEIDESLMRHAVLTALEVLVPDSVSSEKRDFILTPILEKLSLGQIAQLFSEIKKIRHLEGDKLLGILTLEWLQRIPSLASEVLKPLLGLLSPNLNKTPHLVEWGKRLSFDAYSASPREAAESFTEALRSDDVTRSEVREAVRATVRIGAAPVVAELETIRQRLIAGSAFDREKLRVLLENVAEKLNSKFDTADSSDRGYDVTYILPEDTGRMHDFARVITRLGGVGRILVHAPDGSRVPEDIRRIFQKAGLNIVLLQSLRRSPVYLGDQIFSGMVADEGRLKTPPASSFVPVIETGMESESDPLLRELVLTLQTAVALLIAQKGRQGMKPADLYAEALALLKDYELMPGFESRIIQLKGNSLVISSAGVRDFVTEWAALQETSRAA